MAYHIGAVNVGKSIEKSIGLIIWIESVNATIMIVLTHQIVSGSENITRPVLIVVKYTSRIVWTTDHVPEKGQKIEKMYREWCWIIHLLK